MANVEQVTGDKLLNVKQVAEMTGLHPSTLNRARITGTLNTPAFVKIGKAVRYKLSTVQRWIAEQSEHQHTAEYEQAA